MDSLRLTANQLAERFALSVHGDGEVSVHGVATLSTAGAGQLAFLANSRYRGQLAASGASIVVLGQDDAAAAPHTALIPAAVMFITVLSLNFLGDIVRNRVDPRRSAL